MNAVAIITPEPKYFVMKKATGGTCMRFVRAAAIGSRAPGRLYQRMNFSKLCAEVQHIPSIDPTPITKTEDTRRPSRPSYPFPSSHETVTFDMILLYLCDLLDLILPSSCLRGTIACSTTLGCSQKTLICLSIVGSGGNKGDLEDEDSAAVSLCRSGSEPSSRVRPSTVVRERCIVMPLNPRPELA